MMGLRWWFLLVPERLRKVFQGMRVIVWALSRLRGPDMRSQEQLIECVGQVYVYERKASNSKTDFAIVRAERAT